MAGKTRRDRIIDAALVLAAERPWNEVTLARVAETSGVSLADLRREFRNLTSVLMAFLDRIDGEMLSMGDPLDVSDSIRDQVFDLIMRRLDALGPHKAAIRNITAGLAREPGTALRMLGRSVDAQVWILEAAGGGTRGLIGRLRVRGLATVYARTFRVWLDEDDPGLPRTMATLDRALRRGERWVSRAGPPLAIAEGVVCLAASMLGRARGSSPVANGAGRASGET